MQNTLKDTEWTQFVREVCNRHFGIGADGVLVIKSTTESSFPEMLIFNAAGSQAEMCLNGLRCVAHYLFMHHGLQITFKIKMGHRIVDCAVNVGKNKNDPVEIVTSVESPLYYEKTKIQSAAGDFEGHVVSVGNPHFVIFQQCEHQWLLDHGKELEQHSYFPQRTNVEFVWEDSTYRAHNNIRKTYRLLVYERGCGVTLACSSGVTAALWTLFHLDIIKPNDHVAFMMLGGMVVGHVDSNKNVILRAPAVMVYHGDLEHKE